MNTFFTIVYAIWINGHLAHLRAFQSFPVHQEAIYDCEVEREDDAFIVARGLAYRFPEGTRIRVSATCQKHANL